MKTRSQARTTATCITTTRITTARVPTARERLARMAAATSLLLVGGAVALGSDAFACRDGDVAHDHAGRDAVATKSKSLSETFAKPVALSKHAAVGEKGNGSGVTMDARTAKSIAVGVAAALTLDFGPARAEGATARVRTPEGVVVTHADGSPVGDIALAVGRPTRVELLVTARDDGRQYLDVTTTQNERATVRSVALPVGSDTVRMKSAGRVETRPDGSRVRVMQAQ